MPATADYANIKELGLTAGRALAKLQSPHQVEDLLSYQRAKVAWGMLETACAQQHWDVLSAWHVQRLDVPMHVYRLRVTLMYWTARALWGTSGCIGMLEALAVSDADVLEEKGRYYGDSWRKRGGAGAFMMLARKWDRLQEIVEREDPLRQEGAGLITILQTAAGNAVDDVDDLRRYLLLVEDEATRRPT